MRQIIGVAQKAAPQFRTCFSGSRTAAKPSRAMSVKANASALDWGKQDERRMLHAVYRVGDLDKYIKYAQDCFGMKLLRYRDIPDEKYTNAFLGYGDEHTHFALE